MSIDAPFFDLPATIHYRPLRISVAQYHAWIEEGAFRNHENIELLEGILVEKMTKNPPHKVATRKCDLLLSSFVPAGWFVQNQDPITLGTSEPEPDVAVVAGKLGDYRERHPEPGEVELVVEVADASLVTDRYKAQIYAAAGIPHYWIINLIERVVEVHTQPDATQSPARYANVERYAVADAIPVVIGGQERRKVVVSDLLP